MTQGKEEQISPNPYETAIRYDTIRLRSILTWMAVAPLRMAAQSRRRGALGETGPPSHVAG